MCWRHVRSMIVLSRRKPPPKLAVFATTMNFWQVLATREARSSVSALVASANFAGSRSWRGSFQHRSYTAQPISRSFSMYSGNDLLSPGMKMTASWVP